MVSDHQMWTCRTLLKSPLAKFFRVKSKSIEARLPNEDVFAAHYILISTMLHNVFLPNVLLLKITKWAGVELLDLSKLLHYTYLSLFAQAEGWPMFLSSLTGSIKLKDSIPCLWDVQVFAFAILQFLWSFQWAKFQFFGRICLLACDIAKEPW